VLWVVCSFFATSTASAPLGLIGNTSVVVGRNRTLRSVNLGVLSTVESFDDFYQRDYRSLIGLAYVMTGSRWVAEELAQEAMAEAHRKWSKISRYDDPSAWVRRVMVNKKISAARRRRTETKAMNRLRSLRIQDSVDIPDSASEVWTTVCKLPLRQAQAIALFYWEDRPLAEIAAIMGVSVETTKTHLKRGRASLAQMLPPAHMDEQ